jgi:hypothetical protein
MVRGTLFHAEFHMLDSAVPVAFCPQDSMLFIPPLKLPCNLGVSAAFDQAGLLCLVRSEIFEVMVA